jgi:hypothetical protein
VPSKGLRGDGSIFSVELGGATPCDGFGNYDQVNMTSATGNVSVGSAAAPSLSLVDGFTLGEESDFFILTRADSAGFGLTAFAGLPEGATVGLGDGYFGMITYQANWTGTQAGSAEFSGNDVAILNVVPDPAAPCSC